MGIVRGDVAGATASGQNFTQFEDATVIDARAGDIVVDDVVLLTQGQYLRLGPDLMIVGPDGQKVLLADYFAVQTPPDIDGPGASASRAIWPRRWPGRVRQVRWRRLANRWPRRQRPSAPSPVSTVTSL